MENVTLLRVLNGLRHTTHEFRAPLFKKMRWRAFMAIRSQKRKPGIYGKTRKRRVAASVRTRLLSKSSGSLMFCIDSTALAGRIAYRAPNLSPDQAKALILKSSTSVLFLSTGAVLFFDTGLRYPPMLGFDTGLFMSDP